MAGDGPTILWLPTYHLASNSRPPPTQRAPTQKGDRRTRTGWVQGWGWEWAGRGWSDDL